MRKTACLLIKMPQFSEKHLLVSLFWLKDFENRPKIIIFARYFACARVYA